MAWAVNCASRYGNLSAAGKILLPMPTRLHLAYCARRRPLPLPRLSGGRRLVGAKVISIFSDHSHTVSIIGPVCTGNEVAHAEYEIDRCFHSDCRHGFSEDGNVPSDSDTKFTGGRSSPCSLEMIGRRFRSCLTRSLTGHHVSLISRSLPLSVVEVHPWAYPRHLRRFQCPLTDWVKSTTKVSELYTWKRTYRLGPGLVNMGASCWLNATIQNLAYVPIVAQLLFETAKVCGRRLFLSCGTKASTGSISCHDFMEKILNR